MIMGNGEELLVGENSERIWPMSRWRPGDVGGGLVCRNTGLQDVSLTHT